MSLYVGLVQIMLSWQHSGLYICMLCAGFWGDSDSETEVELSAVTPGGGGSGDNDDFDFYA